MSVPAGAVLVTGASTGIGLAVTQRLAARGTPVLAGVRNDVDAAKLDAIANVEAIVLDVANAEHVAQLRERLDGVRLSGLVNNAGIAVAGPLEELDLSAWRQQFDVNFFGVVAVTQASLGALRAGSGRIVNIGSIGGRLGQPFMGPYSASKGAIHLLTESLRRELRPWNIWVSVIEPGAIATEIWRKAGESAPDALSALSDAGRERYGHQLGQMAKQAQIQNDGALPVSVVADAVEHALTAKRPRPTYVLGRPAQASLVLSSVLPARVMDRLIARIIGI